MKESIQKKLIELLYKNFRITDISKDVIPNLDLIDDLSIDSLTFISLLIEIENAFGIIIPDEFVKLDSFRNFDDIVDIIFDLMKEGIEEC